jgi:hydrogenase maturation protease
MTALLISRLSANKSAPVICKSDAGNHLTKKIVVIGLGNQYMRDDGLGIKVAQALKKMNLEENVSVQEYREMDLSVIETLRGASSVIMVDALKGGKKPGTVSKYLFTPRKESPSELPDLHNLKLSDILDFATNSGILTCPVTIVGVEPKDDSLGEGLSSEVEAALPETLHTVVKELENLSAS